MDTTPSNLPAATAADFPADFPPPSNIKSTILCVSSNNIIASLIQGPIPESFIIDQLKKFGLQKLVFPNGVIIYAHVRDGHINFWMDPRIKGDLKRFIGSDQFNDIRDSFSRPNTYGYPDGTLIIMVRHGEAGHNQPEADVKALLSIDPQLVKAMLEKAQLLDPNLKLSDLTEPEKFQLALVTYCQDSDLTDKGIKDANTTGRLIDSWFNSYFLTRPPLRIATSPLRRTRQTADIVKELLGYQGDPLLCSQALERDRKLGSVYWHQGSPQDTVVCKMQRIRASGKPYHEILKDLNSSMYEAVTTILKEPPHLSEAEWEKQTEEFKRPLIMEVNSIWRENIPLENHIVSHPNFDQAPDLLSALALLLKTVIFATDNQRKKKDLIQALGPEISFSSLNCEEIQGTHINVALNKAKAMVAMIGGHVCVEDVSVDLHGESSEFGPMIKWIVKQCKSQVDAAAKQAKDEAERKATQESINPDQIIQAGKAAYEQASLECRGPAFVDNLKRRLGPGDLDYTSTIVLLTKTKQIVIWCTVHSTPKPLTAEEVKPTGGDIDPFLIAKKYNVFVKINDNDAELVESGEFDASNGLTIGQLQAENADHRLRVHPRCIALRFLRRYLSE